MIDNSVCKVTSLGLYLRGNFYVRLVSRVWGIREVDDKDNVIQW